jgi:c-di-GMP-binding flagellar brake protein YcgR
MSNYDSAILDKRELVIKKLAILEENKCVLRADLGKGEGFLVTIIAIDLENSTLILKQTKDAPTILNGGSLQQLYKKMLAAPRVEFKTVFRDVQVAFTGGSIKKMTYKGNQAFQMYIPRSLHWHNRRKYFRKKIPIANSSFCEIVLTIPESDAEPEYKQHYTAATDRIRYNLTRQKKDSIAATTKDQSVNLIRLNLYDVSLAGCSMLNNDEEFSYFLNPHMVYENCKITMPNASAIRVSFEIMMKRTVDPDEFENVGAFKELVGIKFLNIKRDVD